MGTFSVISLMSIKSKSVIKNGDKQKFSRHNFNYLKLNLIFYITFFFIDYPRLSIQIKHIFSLFQLRAMLVFIKQYAHLK